MIFRRLAVEIFVVVTIGALLALLGPFGTYDMSAPMRLAYWIGFILIGYAIFRPVQTVAKWFAAASRVPIGAAMILAGALAALPMAALVGFAIGGMTSDSSYLGEGFGTLYLQVFGIGIAVLLIITALFERPIPARSTPPADAPPGPSEPSEPSTVPEPAAAFFDRLSPSLGTDLVCLEMQDHYVKAHTSRGSEMVLMRMRDAVAEIGDIEGMQVHRSWWVARAHLRGVKRDGRSMALELSNGLHVPVARARQAELKRRGWI